MAGASHRCREQFRVVVIYVRAVLFCHLDFYLELCFGSGLRKETKVSGFVFGRLGLVELRGLSLSAFVRWLCDSQPVPESVKLSGQAQVRVLPVVVFWEV